MSHLGHEFPVERLEVLLLERLGQLQHPVRPEVEDHHLCETAVVARVGMMVRMRVWVVVFGNANALHRSFQPRGVDKRHQQPHLR